LRQNNDEHDVNEDIDRGDMDMDKNEFDELYTGDDA
jgi:hypothetical protein